jgi:hypothetical protein
MVPVILLLAQMGLWYQYRPLRPGEEAIVTMKLNSGGESVWPAVNVSTNPAAEVIVGPVRVLNQKEMNWKIRALKEGYTDILFQIDGKEIKKQLAIGNGFMRINAERPGWHFLDILLNPMEKPFSTNSIVQSISIQYPQRLSHTSGTDWWLIYFFAVSFVFGFILKPFLKINI